jgi:hypothetical protein
MRLAKPVIVAKVLFALLGFSALVTEIATLVAQSRFAAGDFFSYFTVESNALAVASLLVSAFALATGHVSPALDFLRGAVTLYMTTTIIIFIVLLSGYSSDELTAVPWDNTVLHYILPIAVILDWLIDGRLIGVRALGAGVDRISVPRALWWLLFPLAYLVYSLVRGAIVDWYPYPFMDPSQHGYVGVAITSVVIAVVIAAVAAAIALATALPRLAVPRR